MSATAPLNANKQQVRRDLKRAADQQFVGLEWAQAAHELMESNANAQNGGRHQKEKNR